MESEIAIFLHLYYHDLWGEFKDRLLKFPLPFNLYVNLPENGHPLDPIQEEILAAFPNATVIQSPNQGLDVGGQIRLYGKMKEAGSREKYIIFLHSKKSPHNPQSWAAQWRELLLGIINTDRAGIIRTIFDADEKLGIVGAKELLMSEVEDKENVTFDSFQDSIENFTKETSIEFPSQYSFIAGTMFWIRAEILHNFFNQHPINPDDFEHGYPHFRTKAHVFERIFGAVAERQGYRIIGI